jgi:hypothetical protein
MKIQKYLITAAALIVGLTAGACIIAVVDYPAGRDMPSETTTDYYELLDGGELTIESMDGDVTIEGWDRNDVKLVLEKFINTPDSARFGIYGKRDFIPEVDVEETEGALRIRTRSRESDMGYVNFVLKVPHSINLKRIIVREGNIMVSGIYGQSVLEAIKGDITVENYSGSLKTFVEDGSIEAELLDLHDNDDVRLTANRGDVTIRLSSELNAFFEASVSGGEIISDFEMKDDNASDRVSFQVGEEGANIRLSTLDGSIFIRRILDEISSREK